MPDDPVGQSLEDAARGRLFGAGATIRQDREGRALEDQAFAALFGGPPRASAPTRIDKYDLGVLLGGGGMGEVFFGNHPTLGRPVAIKLLRARNQHDPKERERLLREAQALAALNDVNVVNVYDFGLHEDQVFIAMEYVHGSTLRGWQDQERRSWREVLDRYLAAGSGLAAIHKAGLVHRDFKPQNVLVGDDGRLKIADFGLAVSAGDRVPRVADGAALSSEEWISLLAAQLTSTSAVLGTPLYISPEQLERKPVDARSDQFSFCVALYEALYGSHPYAAPAETPESRQSTAGKHSHGAIGTGPSGPPNMMSLVTGLVNGPLRRPERVVIPGRTFRAIERGLSRDPNQRFPSMTALLAALRDDPVRKYGPFFGVGFVGAAIGGVLSLMPAENVCKDLSAEFRDAWSAERAAAVERAFTATKSPYAEKAAAQVVQTLDAYRAEWLAARQDNCEATHQRGEQDVEVQRRRASCLDHARDVLSASVEQLTHADAATVERVQESLDRLPGLETCSAPFQRQQTCFDAVDDPALRERLDRALALEFAGKYKEAADAAGALATDAKDHARLAAEAQLLRGRTLSELNAASGALAAFGESYKLSESAGCDELAFEAATRTVKLIALNFDLPADAGPAWTSVAASRLQKLPESPRLAAALHSDRGLLLQHREDLAGDRARHLEEARTEHDLALALRERLADGRKTLELGMTFLNLGDLETKRRQPEKALQELERSLEYYTAVYGVDHPALWKPYRNRGNALYELGRMPEAREALQRSIALAETGLGDESTVIAGSKYMLAAAHLDSDDRLALKLATEALAIYDRELPNSDPRRLRVLRLIAQIHYDRNEFAQALNLREEIVRRMRDLGPGVRANAHYELGITLLVLARPEEALTHARVAAAILAEMSPVPPALVAEIEELNAESARAARPTKKP